MQVQLSRMKVIHYPRLDTVLMIEEAIRSAKNYPNKAQLWKALPKQVMYQTFSLVLDYLQDSNKVLITKEGRVMWIGGNPKLNAAIARGKKVR